MHFSVSVFHDFSRLASVWDETPGKQMLGVCQRGVCGSFLTRSEISCKSLEGQEGLRQLIFHVTCSMKDVGSTIGCQRLAGRLVGTTLVQLKPGGLHPICGEPERPSLPAVSSALCPHVRSLGEGARW